MIGVGVRCARAPPQVPKRIGRNPLEHPQRRAKPERYGEDLKGVLRYGASPRATIALDRCSRAHAWLAGRDFVTPEDVQEIAHDVLRHRILLGFEAEASGRTPDELVDTLLKRIGVP